MIPSNEERLRGLNFGDIYLTDLTLFGMEITFGSWTYPISVFVIIIALVVTAFQLRMHLKEK